MHFKKRLANLCKAALIVAATGISATHAQNLTSKGTDFYATFTQNYQTSVQSLELFISSTEAASGTIEFLETGTSQTFTTTPNQTLRIQAPSSSQLTSNMVVEKKGIYVKTDKEISLYGLSNELNTTDAFLSLPTTALGSSYRVVSYSPTSGFKSTIGIVATKDGSNITITPTRAVLSNPANTPINVTLNQGETYQIMSDGDLTGSTVTSNQPIAVLSGATCVNTPVGVSACDMLIEQMIPTTSWGTSFFTAPLAGRSGGSRYRVLADQDGTEVTINGISATTLAAGAYYETNSVDALAIKTSKPAMVVQFANSKDFDPTNSTGDPFMMLIPPAGLYINDYTLATADADPASPRFTTNYLGIVSPIDPATQQAVDVSLDGVLIPKADFQLSPAKDFFFVNKAISAGSYHISSPVGVGVTIYGFTDYDSYGYVGGLGLAKIANIKEIKLTPAEDATHWINEQYCISALVTDNADVPLNSVKIDVTLSGANSQLSSIYTDATGKAPFCYSSALAGADTLVLAAGGKTATSKVKWLQGAGDATLTLTPATASNPINAQQCFVAKLVDASSQPLANMAIGFDVVGVNAQQSAATTNASGEAPLCYAGANSGSDAVSASSGPLKQSATAVWTVPVKPQTLSLSPSVHSGMVNTSQCFVATLVDASNVPVANQQVAFSVTGVSTQVSSIATDASGNAKLCYTSANAGVDTITASADSEIKSARSKAMQVRTASMTWMAAGASVQATPVPTLHPAMLVLLASLVGGMAWRQRRRTAP